MAGGDDDTIRLKVARAGRSSSRRLLPWSLAAGVVTAAAAGITWFVLQPAPPPPAAPSAALPPTQVPAPPATGGSVQTAGVVVPPSVPAPPTLATPTPTTSAPTTSATTSGTTTPPPAIPAGFAPPATTIPPVPPTPPDPIARTATYDEILADNPDTLTIYRFAPQPGVVVLQFPSLHAQADMLNRVAALIEKSGFPRSRVLSHADLEAKIRARGDSPDSFYYGHDYRAADIAHFFQLATDLDDGEARLKSLVQQLGWDASQPVGALVSLVRQSPSSGMDRSMREAILQHELSHGVYFTDPAYAAFCAHFWQDVLSAPERTHFTEFLGREGYDTSIPDLMINETQAYLMHTPDQRFFDAADVHIPPARLNELRQIFVVGMPPGWLRDHTKVAALP